MYSICCTVSPAASILSGPYSQLTMGLRWRVVWPILDAFGWRTDRLLRMESHHARPRNLSTAPRSLTSSLINVGASFAGEWSHTANTRGHGWSSCSTNHQIYRTSRRGLWWNCTPIPSDCWRRRWSCGDFSLADQAGRGRKPVFPPRDQAIVKAIACEAVSQTKLPLSRLSSSDLAGRAATALGKAISPSTVWRILDADAIKPWRYEYWIFPRDPRFAEKAGRVWTCTPACGTESRWAARTTSSARTRRRASRPASGVTRRCRLVRGGRCAFEHEYGRGGALQYLAAWDVRRGRVLSRCEDRRPGWDSFGRLVEQVMRRGG